VFLVGSFFGVLEPKGLSERSKGNLVLHIDRRFLIERLTTRNTLCCVTLVRWNIKSPITNNRDAEGGK
jgi:hypothetical protein